jgi:hypothetical protein
MECDDVVGGGWALKRVGAVWDAAAKPVGWGVMGK